VIHYTHVAIYAFIIVTCLWVYLLAVLSAHKHKWEWANVAIWYFISVVATQTGVVIWYAAKALWQLLIH
jgi:hypothetical protein